MPLSFHAFNAETYDHSVNPYVLGRCILHSYAFYINMCCCCCCCCCWVLQSCLTVQPHRRQPIRLRCAWDSSGVNTRVGCHFLLQCMKVKSESEVAQSCPTLSDPMDCSLPGSSIHGIFQARVLEWGAIAFSELICEIVNKSRKSKRAGLWRSKKRQREIPRGAKDGLSPAFSLMWSCLHHK